MENKMISVIVPVYKVERYLDKCIQSIVRQTYSNLEIILVDDGSPDNCPQMCNEWARKDTRIKVIHKKNGGLSAARNVAMDIARGEYYAFVDSDDYIEDTMYERAMDLFAQNNSDIVSFNAWLVDEAGKKLGTTENVPNGMLSQEDALYNLMRGNINNYAWNKVYRRRVFDGVRFPEGRSWEDMAVAYKLFLNAECVCCCDEAMYYYVQRGGSIIHTMGGKALEGIFCARYESYESLKGIYPDVAAIAFDRTILSARRLYDRSLWEKVNDEILKQAMTFLKDNKQRILDENKSAEYRIYYYTPWLYTFLRICKHGIGNVVRKVNKWMYKG